MLPLTAPEAFFGIVQLHPDTDPGAVAPTLAQKQPDTLQFNEELPDELLDAAADALRAFPEICLRVYDAGVDPSLGSLARFEDIRCLSLDVLDVTSFDALASFRNLQRLGLGETTSTKPSLAFLRNLPQLWWLGVNGNWKNFEAVGAVRTLRHLGTHVGKGVDLGALRGHPALEVLDINFGTNRDLSALAEIPCLRGLELYQIQRLDDDDLAPLADCASLVALSLGALRNVRNLRCLRGGPAKTLRYLILEKLQGLETLADLAACEALEQVHMIESKPADGRLDLLARAKNLQALGTGDHYSKEQRDATEATFRGHTLWTRGRVLRGDAKNDDVLVAWRRSVGAILEVADAQESATP